jgi:branched-subunit amino acid aminotransferase/4-amino-4-deoxychorismate lyase
MITKAIPTFILMPDGLVPTPYQVGSLAEAVPHEPQGIYTVARTFHGDHALLFDAHLDRLEESARLVHIPLRLDRARLRAALRDMLHEASYPDAKFRITIPEDKPDNIYLAIEPYQPVPEAVQQHGATVATVPLVRKNPVAKTTDWMSIRRPSYERLPAGVYEGILVSEDGMLLEGMSCNFYGIVDGTLYTASNGVLAGITRMAVLQIAPEIVPVKLQALQLADVPRLSEAMLTSSGRGVVPITMIDNQPVGTGRVGPLVAQIRQRYEDWTETHSEPI